MNSVSIMNMIHNNYFICITATINHHFGGFSKLYALNKYKQNHFYLDTNENLKFRFLRLDNDNISHLQFKLILVPKDCVTHKKIIMKDYHTLTILDELLDTINELFNLYKLPIEIKLLIINIFFDKNPQCFQYMNTPIPYKSKFNNIKPNILFYHYKMILDCSSKTIEFISPQFIFHCL